MSASDGLAEILIRVEDLAVKCYICGEEATGMCHECGKWFCDAHGRWRGDDEYRLCKGCQT